MDGMNTPSKPGGLVMDRLDVTDARGEALFASQLQQSDAPTAPAVVEAIRQAVRRFGVHGCAAHEFGDHPGVAVERMRWARQVVGAVFAGPGQRPAPLGQLPARLHSQGRGRHLALKVL
jgi:hypothetical protein